MKQAYTYLLLLLLAASVLGCKKDDTSPSKTDLLTNKNWIITAYTVSPGISLGGTTVTDIYSQYQPCSKDDFIRFETPNVYKEDQGATKCSSTTAQTSTGTWAFSSNDTVLTITQSGSSETFTITSLTDSSLVLTFTQAANNITYTYTVTFRKG